MTEEGRLVYKILLLITLTISLVFSSKKILNAKDEKLIRAYSLVDVLSVLAIIYVAN